MPVALERSIRLAAACAVVGMAGCSASPSPPSPPVATITLSQPKVHRVAARTHLRRAPPSCTSELSVERKEALFRRFAAEQVGLEGATPAATTAAPAPAACRQASR